MVGYSMALGEPMVCWATVQPHRHAFGWECVRLRISHQVQDRFQSARTTSMVSLRTSGSTDSKMGNAMSQESAQALGHTLMKSPPSRRS